MSIPQIHSSTLMTFHYFDHYDVTDTGNLTFKFLLNPDKLAVKRTKKEKYVLTKAGWERNFFINDLMMFSYSGTTGVFRPDELVGSVIGDVPVSSDSFNITTTKKWRHFQLLQEFFESLGEGMLQMTYWGLSKPVIGSMNDFDFVQDSEKPNHIAYSFKFTGIPRDIPTISVKFADELDYFFGGQ